MVLRGVDLSSWQPKIEWPIVAASGEVDFAIVKATESNNYANPFYAAQLAGAREHGILAGSYHYARPDENTVEAQVAFFLAHLDHREGEPIALDMEEGRGPLSAWSLAWLAQVEHATGLRPLFYSYPSFFDEHDLHDPGLARYPLWLADYNATPRKPPAPWTSVAIRQYTADGYVPGIGGGKVKVDLNRFDGDAGAWKLLAGVGEVVARLRGFAPAWQAGGTFTQRFRLWRTP